LIGLSLAVTAGCGVILGVGNEEFHPPHDGGAETSVAEDVDGGTRTDGGGSANDADATIGEASAPDVTLPDASSESGEGPPPVQVRYGGGRVLTGASRLVAIYWGEWIPARLNQWDVSIEQFFTFISTTPHYYAIGQYYGIVDGGRVPVPTGGLNFQSQRYFNDPDDGGVRDPNAYVESLVSPGDVPDTIYVIFFNPVALNPCGSRHACSGLTPNLHIPYIRTPYNDDYSVGSRLGFRELVNVITNSDGQGWTVPYQGQSYSLGDMCSRNLDGVGLGSEAIVRLWDRTTVYGVDGMFSALSNGGMGACVDTYANRGLLAMVDGDAGTTTANSLIGAPAPPGGLSIPYFPTTDNVSIAAAPDGIAYMGLWTITPGGGLSEASPVTNDLSGLWGGSGNQAALPAPFIFSSGLDVTTQGEARWDAFVLGTAPTADASVAPQLFHQYWDEYLSPTWNGWTSFGDATGLAGVTKIVSSPGVTSFAPGRFDGFVLGATSTGNHLLRVWCDDRMNGVHIMGTNCDTPTAWADLGKPPDGADLIGDPDAASWPSGKSDGGHLAVVCAATDGTIRLFRDDNGAVTWTTLTPPPGRSFAPSPTITGMGDERYLVAARTRDGSVWQWLYDWGPGTWTPSSVPTGPIAIDLTAY
jgi:hypothetical protein